MDILLSVDEKIIRVNKLVCFGKYVKARRLLEEILEEEPDHAKAHYEMAMISISELQNYSMAEYHLKLAMKFDPAYVYSYYVYQWLLLLQSRYEELETFSNKMLEIKLIDNCATYKILGLGFEEQLKLKKAKKQYEKAMKHALNDSTVYQLNQSLERIRNKQEKRKPKENNK